MLSVLSYGRLMRLCHVVESCTMRQEVGKVLVVEVFGTATCPSLSQA